MFQLAWRLFCFPLIAPLVAGTPVFGPTKVTSVTSPDLVERAGTGPSAYPYGISSPNDFSWLDWDPQDQGTQKAEGQKIYSAWGDMQYMIYFAWKEADKKSTIFKRWFDEADADNVKKVLERIVDFSGAGSPTPLMKDWVCERNDNFGRCTGQKNAWSAWQRGVFHICPHGLAQPDAKNLQCTDLDGFASQKMKSVGFTLMHEAMHWQEIGDNALGKHIRDHANGASDCFNLAKDDKLTNAQNYAFLGAEAWFTVKGCTFTDPPPGTQGTDDFDDEVEDPPADTNAINIILRQETTETLYPSAWYFYDTPVGESALCKPEDGAIGKFDIDSIVPGTEPPWPNGIYSIKTGGMNCEYKNNNEDAGALWCEGRDGPIGCKKENDYGKGKFCSDRIFQTPYVYCQWSQ
ncbi:hypothetical protein EJ04DRAFT_564753 [Polyplosphaeria fusca]|uniref:Lysine-specific metallo-endopeptidase domain-containing protein n=1 Tax=Polyplosphaeria fusca TaxID=682080 RepID=A0A9P4QZS0_9PLEO|nr:hypothetical protein EJ04DRAFT_564753 [Polyplosphaeria fusca]